MESAMEEIKMETKTQIKILKSDKYGFRYFIDANVIAKQLVARSYEKLHTINDGKKNVSQEVYILSQEKVR